jgi:hypothetical protein
MSWCLDTWKIYLYSTAINWSEDRNRFPQPVCSVAKQRSLSEIQPAGFSEGQSIWERGDRIGLQSKEHISRDVASWWVKSALPKPTRATYGRVNSVEMKAWSIPAVKQIVRAGRHAIYEQLWGIQLGYGVFKHFLRSFKIVLMAVLLNRLRQVLYYSSFPIFLTYLSQEMHFFASLGWQRLVRLVSYQAATFEAYKKQTSWL